MVRYLLVWLMMQQISLATVKSNTVVHATFGSTLPSSFHPHHSSNGLTTDYINLVFENLFRLNHEGKLHGQLAREWKKLTPTDIEVEIKKGVLFHNGEPCTAESIKFSFDRFLDPNLKIDSRFYGKTIKSVEILTPHKVLIRTHTPDPYLVYRLALVTPIIPKTYHETVGEQFFSQKPIGTGRYQLIEDRNDHNRLIFRRFEKHWNKSIHSPKEIHVSYLKSSSEILSALKKTEIDFASRIPGFLSPKIYKIPHINLLKKESMISILTMFNTKKGPLLNKELRKVIFNIIDTNEITEKAYYGNASSSSHVTFKGEPSHPQGQLKAHKMTPKEIKSSIKKLKEEGLLKKPIKILVTHPYELAGRIISHQLQNYGIPIVVTYGDNELENKWVVKKNLSGQTPNLDLLITYCSHKYGTGYFPLSILFHSKANWSLTADKKYDTLLDKALVISSDKSRYELLKKASQYLIDEYLVHPGFRLKELYAINKKLSYTPHISGHIFFDQLSVNR